MGAILFIEIGIILIKITTNHSPETVQIPVGNGRTPRFVPLLVLLARPVLALVIGAILLAACACIPDYPPKYTPTPGKFILLDPSPTPPGNSLPLPCQVTDLNLYVERAAGYCFTYPTRFNLGDQPSDQPSVLGAVIGSDSGEVNVTFNVEVTLSDPEKSLNQQVDVFLKSFSIVDPSLLARDRISVGGEPAIQVDQVPAQLNWRIVFVQHAGTMYRLMYMPVGVPEAESDLEELYQVTINSFSFIPKTD